VFKLKPKKTANENMEERRGEEKRGEERRGREREREGERERERGNRTSYILFQ